MNIYIMVDAEGISGVFDSEQVSTSSSSGRYNEGRELMVRDINACVEAYKEAGAEKVYVRDCHGGGANVIWSKFSSLADYYIVVQTGQDCFPGLEDCDGVILLGYHVMAGTYGDMLEHTMSSASVQNYWNNGQLAGEVAIDAGIVGDRGKPVIMVSGDDKVCCEAEALLPGVVTAEVKKGITWKGGMILPLEKAYAVIKAKTKEAISRLSEQKPLVYKKPIRLRVELKERNLLPTQYSKLYMTILDGRTYEVEGSTMEETLFRL
ncbi:MAG: M55 family metallopeptidase [Firmicutes bacterium]|nr:M55 family metallopeptidase [Bacillota bacterium]